MSAERTERTQAESRDGLAWGDLTAARSANQFCRAWLSLQCGRIPRSTAALLLLRDDDGRFAPAAVWPDPAQDVTHLGKAAEAALRQGEAVIVSDRPLQVAVPVFLGASADGVVSIGLAEGADPAAALDQIRWGLGWLEALLHRRRASGRETRLSAATFSLDMLAAVGRHDRLQTALDSLCATLATRLACRRVSAGVFKNGRMRLSSISNTAIHDRKRDIVEAIETAMEEAADQGSTCVWPARKDERAIILAQAELGRAAGASSVATVLLFADDAVAGAVTLERHDGPVLGQDEIRGLESAGALLGPQVAAMIAADAIVGGRAGRAVADWTGMLFGRRHPAVKLAAVLLLGVLAWLVFARGDFRVSAKAVVESRMQRAAVAPFDGFIARAEVRAGDAVRKGQILASLDDHELALQAVRVRSERAQNALKYDDAMGRHDRPAARQLAAAIAESDAQLSLVEDQLARAGVVAPFDGVVISGDLSQMLGSPVERGKLLFEVAPQDSYRVALQVSERDIAFVKPGQDGTLVLSGLSSEAFAIVADKVTPVATSANGQTGFRVEAAISDPGHRLRPGLEGVGKLDAGRRPLLSIWLRSLIDWARLTLWTWLP